SNAVFELLRKLILRADPLSALPAQGFQLVNSSWVLSQKPGASSQHSFSHSPMASCDSRYWSVAAVTACGGFRPSRCHIKHPLIIHARMPGHSALSSSVRYRFIFSATMVTANGTRLKRRVMALFIVRSVGMWLPLNISLNCG